MITDKPTNAPPASSDDRLVSRRRFLAIGAGGMVSLGLAGLVGYEWPHTSAPASRSLETSLSDVQTFVTRPDLRPPVVRVTHHRRAVPPGTPDPVGALDAERFIFIAPRALSATASQQGLMICDRDGRLVWFQPIEPDDPFDFNTQLEGTVPRLTWWQGEVVAGHGVGTGEIADTSYRVVGAVQAGDGLRADLHELNLTAAGTALITAYENTHTDLRPRGGSRRGKVLAGHAQEIDLRTGKVLFDWNSLDHVGVAESYLALPGEGTAYDYFHINSIAETPDRNLLISARNTWTVYKVDRSTGAVLWRLNGRRSDFAIGPGAHFYWQHDAGMPNESTITLFDDGSAPPEEKQSRGLLLDVDTANMQVNLRRAYEHPAGFISANQGSMQLLPDGRVFVGWGNQPYFSEFAPDGTLLLDGEFPIGIRSYRAFTHDWVAHPVDRPAIALRSNPGGGSIVYLSWNGATEVASWRVLAGDHRHDLTTVGSQEWTGFETAIAVNSSGPYYAGAALDSNGRELGRSSTVT